MLDVILGQVPPTETTRMGLTFTTVTPSPPVRRPKIKVVPRRQDWNELLGTSRTEDRDLKSHIMQGKTCIGNDGAFACMLSITSLNAALP